MIRIEIPAGAIDGVNTVYNTNVPYVAGTCRPIVNGILLDPTLANGLVENGGTTFTMKVVLLATYSLQILYDDGRYIPRKTIKVLSSIQTLSLIPDTAQKYTAIVSSDRRSRLSFQFLDGNSNPMDLSGVTPRLKLRMQNDTRRINDATNAMTLDVVAQGLVHYDFAPSDLATVGVMEGWVVADYGAGDTWTAPFPLLFQVIRAP